MTKEKLWNFATSKELEEYKRLKNDGAFECIYWLFVMGYLNTNKIVEEFEVWHNDDLTLLHCLVEKYKNSK